MHSNSNRQSGIGVLGVITLVLALTGVGLIGFSVYAKNKKANDKPAVSSSKVESLASQNAKDEPLTPEAYQPPKGWLAYAAEGGLGFYYPGTWDKAAITINHYSVYESIPSNFGTPDSIIYDQTTKNWTKYLNYGTSSQEELKLDPNDEYRIRTTTAAASNYPIAYVRMGHAAAVTYDILVINEDSAYRIRLPEINTFDEDWTERMAAESAAVPDIIKSLKFTK